MRNQALGSQLSRWVAGLVIAAVQVSAFAAEVPPETGVGELIGDCDEARVTLKRVVEAGGAARSFTTGAFDEAIAQTQTAAALARDIVWTPNLIAPAKRVRSAISEAEAALAKLKSPKSLSNLKATRKFAILADRRLELALARLVPIAAALPAPIVDQPEVDVPPIQAPPSAPVLTPGTGFTAATSQPSTVGTGSGSDAVAIARWDVVPYQTFDRTLVIGVVAFHMNGIDRVEFSADGGTWTSVSQMTLNPDSGVWEYCATLRASDFSDGQLEVRAIAYPTVGIPRVLQGLTRTDASDRSLLVSANSGGTLRSDVRYCDSVNGSDSAGDGSQQRPFASAYRALMDVHNDNGGSTGACDGAVIYLQPGNYSWGPSSSPYPSTRDRWATITTAPGVSRSQVVFTGSGGGGFRTRLIRAQNVSMAGEWTISVSGSEEHQLWLDGCDAQWSGTNLQADVVNAFQWAATFMTDTTISGYRNGIHGVTLARNSVVRNIRSDAFSGSTVLINCSADGLDPGTTANHPDVYQFVPMGQETQRSNFIIYGLKVINANSQGIFAKNINTINDVAFVNCSISRPASAYGKDPPFSQWMNPSTSHLLLWNVTLPNYTFLWRASNISNVSVSGCVFYRMTTASAMSGNAVVVDPTWFRYNHYIGGTANSGLVLGTGAQTGTAGFVSVSSDDYRPASSSALLGANPERKVPVDLAGSPRASTDTIGAYSR